MSNNNKREETPTQDRKNVKENICQHKKTVALNEEGHAGVYCISCGKQVEKEC